jgi:molecular chaperone GrpE
MTEKKKPTPSKNSKKNELHEITELLQRTQANFENFRKQQEKRMGDIREMAAKDMILQLLPVIDNFDLALRSAHSQNNKTQNTPEFIKGVELIYSQLLSLLEANEVEVIKTEKKKFDPYFHEAIMKVESDLPENSIVEEFQKGYILNDKVIRHAKVKISTGKNNQTLEE